jgi:hypothetical protein
MAMTLLTQARLSQRRPTCRHRVVPAQVLARWVSLFPMALPVLPHWVILQVPILATCPEFVIWARWNRYHPNHSVDCHCCHRQVDAIGSIVMSHHRQSL